MRVPLITFLIAAAACARPLPDTTSTALTGQMCGEDRVPNQDTQWREVKGPGFTYCVPVHWTGRGPRAEHWQSNEIEFFIGESSEFTQKVPFAVRRGDGAMMGDPIEAPARPTVLSEEVDGRMVRLTLTEPTAGGRWRTVAEWMQPALTLQGSARNASGREEILAAFRSVRFRSAR